jgi:hypothetical protein
LKDGDPIPEGYKVVVDELAEPLPSGRSQKRGISETAAMTTPPKATETTVGEGGNTTKSKTNARRNMTRNTNRKANTSFARQLKESLATGQSSTIKVAEDSTDLKARWQAAAKEVAYKFLDLTKENWKEYSSFEKTVVHNELNAQFKFEPPLDGKVIDKYLSCHLRTSRAVWKAHWKKFGPEARHYNCPEAAWEKLCRWWPTDACREETAEMASRRAKVERTNKVGRSSLMDRMNAEVSNARCFCAFRHDSPVL